jgi:hypothetical protein
VDIGDTPQDLPDGCSNCGCIDAARRKRMFLEPKGFVTSAADNKGKDPGSSRRRVRPADEARLIAAPRPEQFQATELPFLQTGLLLARGSDDGELKGSLFVANRGTYGEGYYRCLFCNFCAPAQRAKKSAAKKVAGEAGARRFVHNDPSSGQKCKQDVMPKMGLDFAHTFNTDVRLLRFLSPLPEPTEIDVSTRHFHEQLARTVAEACRLAASDLLHLHPGGLRSTYRLYSTAGNILEVVLYDGVPGGAGYSARLGSPQFSFPQLIEAARRRLECPADCESACRACLCDYGNQRHWDSFRRKDAQSWLKRLSEGKTLASGPGSYVPWSKPSLAGLAERFASYKTINAVGISLTGAAGYKDGDLNQLLSWLQAGKQVHLYVVNKLEVRPKDYQVLVLYRHIHPWVLDGKLHIHALQELDGNLAGQLPRLFVSDDDSSPLVRLAFPIQGLLDGLVTAPAEWGAMDVETRDLIHKTLERANEYPAEYFAEGQKMTMWEFSVGMPRSLGDVFSALKGLHVKRLAVRDPYAGAPQNRGRLRQLLDFLKSHTTALECVDVYCSQSKTRDRDGTEHVESILDVQMHVEKILDALAIPKGEAYVKELGRNRTFHDRELTFETVDSTGGDETHRYFLTGGIDYLLDERSDTKVFHARSTT